MSVAFMSFRSMYEHLMRWQWELDNIFLLDAVCIVGVVCIVECLACVERAASGTKAPMTDLWPTGMCSRKESHDESMEKGYKKLCHEIFGQMWLRYTATIRWTNPIWLSESCKTNLSSSLSLSLSLSLSCERNHGCSSTMEPILWVATVSLSCIILFCSKVKLQGGCFP